MAENRSPTGEKERIPYWQVFLDDVSLLLALGITVPVVLYILWSIWDLTNVPLFVP